ncbi:MAG: ion channel [Planctomycetota bacterium]
MHFKLRIIRLTRKLRARRSLGFGVVGMLLIACVVLNATLFWLFDRRVEPDLDYETALWYSIISITTIGYGDYSAQSLGARVSTIIFIVIIGLSVFSLFFGMVIDGVSEAASRNLKGQGRVMAKDHVLIVHYPSETRVRQLIDEIRSDPQHGAEEIVLISDQIDELPFREENVMFIRGSTHDIETYRRASTETARMAMVLSRDYGDPNSDAIVAAAVSVIDSIKPDIYIVAELLNDHHRDMLRSVRCDAVVSGLNMAGNLIVQEVHDPGISRVMEVITSNREGDTLYSTEVTPDGPPDVPYTDLVSGLLGQNVNVLAINRDGQILTTFANERSREGDRVVYVAKHRRHWPELAAATR